jgi:hypothetical protein
MREPVSSGTGSRLRNKRTSRQMLLIMPQS